MSFHESDREDLFAEATALVRCAEVATSAASEPAVIGFRRDGSMSVYLGADPVYHFDPEGRLTRAYEAGRLYRSQGTTLAELTRERTAAETTLLRRDLPATEFRTFIERAIHCLVSLAAGLEGENVRRLRGVAGGSRDFLDEVRRAVARIAARPLATSLAPRYRGKR